MAWSSKSAISGNSFCARSSTPGSRLGLPYAARSSGLVRATHGKGSYARPLPAPLDPQGSLARRTLSPVLPSSQTVSTEKNKLYYGDNLEVLRRYVKDESVDLIYLDPPFNSRQDYNVLFAEKDGTQSSSQIHAFEDTWEWNTDAMRAYEEIVEQGGRVADTMRAFKTFLFNTDMMAYLAMMAPRLVELRRVLKQTGSIYLHCDPTASPGGKQGQTQFIIRHRLSFPGDVSHGKWNTFRVLNCS